MGTKVYKGIRRPDGDVFVTVQEEGFQDRPLPHVVWHSPDGFNWGYGGSGSAELARCILLDFMGRNESREIDFIHQEFKWEFISGIKEDTWEISGEQISRWLFARMTLFTK